MKYTLFIFSFLILIISSNSAIGDNNYIINEDTVYIDDSKVYLSATPHTLSSSGWVYFNLTLKIYTGNIDACWGFNTSVSKPTKAEVYNPHWVNTTTNHEKIFYNSTHIVYTGNDLNYGNSYNTNYKYTTTESIVNDNGTTYITSNVAFDSYTTDGTNYTIYWYTRHDNLYLWEDFSSSFNSVIHDYEGYNKWYYIKNVPIISNKEYIVRAWIDVPVSTQKQSGKYYFAIKPSSETISQAVNNGHFYNLDPWWNATWSNRKNITLTGNTSGAQTDYQLLLNISYDSDMQSDFDDLRFTNDTHEIDAWLESKVDSSYALVWVEFPTTPANGVNQTYYMYYGNAGAASDWDIGATFLFGDDFSGDLSKWSFSDAVGSGGSASIVGGRLRIISKGSNKHVGVSNSTFSTGILEADMETTPNAHYQWGGAGFGNSETNHFLPQRIYTGVQQARAEWNVGVGYQSAGVISAAWTTWYAKAVLTGSLGKMYGKESRGDTWTAFKEDLSYSPTVPVRLASHDDNAGGADGIVYFDNVRVRKYAANPPTYAFGSEEHYTPLPTTIADETKLIMSEITSGLKNVNMGNYLVYAFILIGILLIILLIQILNNCIYRG